MRIRANGVDINYRLDGPADAPVVTMSHSLAANLAMWEPQARALSDRYRVLRYDTRGHGQSEATDGPYTLEMLSEDAYALLGALGIERTHFVGLSLGGMLGQRLALDHPEVVESLALCDTSSRVPPEMASNWDVRIDLARSQGMEPLVEGTLERWFTEAFRGARPDVVATVAEMIRTTAVAGYAGCCDAVKTLNLIDSISAIGAPTLVIVGADDQGTPVAASEAIRDRIPGAKLVVLEDAAHLSNLEQEAAFTAALAQFIDAHALAPTK